MTFAAVSTVAMSLFLIGGLGYAYFRVQEYAKTIPSKFEMRLFLKDDITGEAKASKIAEELRNVPGIAKVTWIPRDKYWELQKREFPELTEGIENPYPESFKIQVTDLNVSNEVASTLGRMPEALRVTYLKDEQEFIDRLLQVLRLLGVTFGGLLFVTAGILIYNAIRLTAHARRIEVRIMQLVGASKLTILVPFLIEGLVQGLVGGALAGAMVLGTNNLALSVIRQLKHDAALPPFPTVGIIGILAAIGASYGFLCSLIAMRTPVRDR